MKLKNLLTNVETIARRKSPIILTGLAIAGVISSVYAAYKAGSRAEKILEEYHKDMEDCLEDDKEAKREVVKETAKKMIPVMAPPIIMGAATIGSIVGSHSVSSRRIAALSAAYTISESTVKNLNGKMEEMLGEKKARSIRDSIMKDKLKKDSEKDQKIISESNYIISNDSSVLCKDMQTGRLFHSNAEKINQAITKCSVDLITDMYVSLNDLYDEIDSPELEGVPLGDVLGWNVDDLQDGRLPITLTALLTADNKPCLCMDYDVSVRDDYRSLK